MIQEVQRGECDKDVETNEETDTESKRGTEIALPAEVERLRAI